MTDRAGHRPLVAFTSLAIAGAGLVAASGFFRVTQNRSYPAGIAAGAGLLAVGLAISLGHLGRKWRAPLAVRGVGRSALSNEAVAGAAALALAAVAAGLPLVGTDPSVVAAAAGAVSAGFLFSIGMVYRLGGQSTWQGFSTLTPLTGGVAFGAVALESWSGGGTPRSALLFLVIDALVFSRRWRGLTAIPLSATMMADPWHRRRTELLGARFFLLDVIPFFVLAAGPLPVALISASAGLLADRVGFYALALQQTTESEVAAVESRLAAP
jgi:DMSO reductase anchor subunit